MNLKRNPSKKGYYCHVYSIDFNNLPKTLVKCVIRADSKEAAKAILEKAINYDPEKDPEYKFTLDEVIVFS